MAGAAGRPAADTAAALRDVTDAIVTQTTLGVWVLDASDRTSFANDRMAEIVGSSPDRMLGAAVYDFLDSEAAEATRVALRRRRAGISELRELHLRRSDGSTVDVFVESMPVNDADGEYVGAVALVGDISGQRQIEREVSLLAALVQSSSDAIVACSLDATIQSWNPAAEALFGWSAGEMVGRSLGTLLAAGSEGAVRLLGAAANGTLVGPLETDAVAKDRTRIPVELTAFPVDDEMGQISMVATTLRDVRERRESERLMREVERARTDVEKVGQLGTFEWSPDSAEVVWSDEVWRIHGRAPGGPVAVGYLDSVHPDDRESVHEAVLDAVDRDAELDLRYRIVVPGGEVRWLHTHAQPAPAEGSRRMVGTIRDVTDLVHAEEEAQRARAELDRQALHDPLTSLPNRTLLLDRLAVALAHAGRTRSGVAVIVSDIDRFELVNEELGHAFADQLLKAVGQRLVGIMRAGDTVGRLVGDEFAIVCESIEADQCAIDALAARVLDAFGEPFAVGGQEIYLLSSVGAAWTPEPEPAEAMLARAYAALRSAKESERGSFVVAQPGNSRPYSGRGRLALRQSLREALGTDQLRVVYQPIIELETGRRTGFEALLRWEHPGLGPVSPLEFIPVAEDTGLILPIGEWVLGEACATLRRFEPDIAIAVNLSPRQLMQQDLPAVVGAALLESGVDPHRLILELTESILVEDSDLVGMTLAELKKIGVRLALDDFGTGYSALGYLKRFPFDIVKVDRSFVRGLGEDAGDSAIVGAVLGMARALGMAVVAEGIETETQLACLRELGVDYGQGFYFARPGSAEGEVAPGANAQA
ncbi:MAG TPA: EAL domain-containing protein [Thermoleophilaceae bacterium]|nr:EAL domain-containing protein [Thermoleophilaceae bacterium]